QKRSQPDFGWDLFFRSFDLFVARTCPTYGDGQQAGYFRKRRTPFAQRKPLGLRIDLRVAGILLNKFPTWRHFIAHQHREDTVALCSVLDGYLTQRTMLRIHRCLPKLFRIHLSKTLVTLYAHRVLLATAF